MALLKAIVYIYFLGQVHSASVEITCPETFTDNQTSAVICVIDSNTITEAGCKSVASHVNFTMQRADASTPDTLCTVAPYPCTSALPTPAPNTCACTNISSNGSVFTYTLRLRANKTTDDKGKVSCHVCGDATVALHVKSQHCSLLNFVSASLKASASVGANEKNKEDTTKVMAWVAVAGSALALVLLVPASVLCCRALNSRKHSAWDSAAARQNSNASTESIKRSPLGRTPIGVDEMAVNRIRAISTSVSRPPRNLDAIAELSSSTSDFSLGVGMTTEPSVLYTKPSATSVTSQSELSTSASTMTLDTTSFTSMTSDNVFLADAR